MKQINIQDSCITVTDPSQLVLDVDEFFVLGKEQTSQVEFLVEREKSLYNYLGERKNSSFSNILFFTLDLTKIEATVNKEFEDGIDLDEEFTTIQSPYDRTIRRKNSKIEPPMTQHNLDKSQITSIVIGDYMKIASQSFKFNRQNMPLLVLPSNYEDEIKTR